MTEKTAVVHWEGQGKKGLGKISTETGALKHYPYGFASRFEDDRRGTNPEEILGAAPVVLEAARKAVGVVLQRPGLGTYLALALLALAFPVNDGGLVGHDVAPVSVWVEGVTNCAALVQKFRYARLRPLYEIELEWRSS